MSENEKMSESEKDQLIDAQKEVIGILFEVIKRLQTNNDLDQEYFEIMQKDDKIWLKDQNGNYSEIIATDVMASNGAVRNLTTAVIIRNNSQMSVC